MPKKPTFEQFHIRTHLLLIRVVFKLIQVGLQVVFIEVLLTKTIRQEKHLSIIITTMMKNIDTPWNPS